MTDMMWKQSVLQRK